MRLFVVFTFLFSILFFHQGGFSQQSFAQKGFNQNLMPTEAEDIVISIQTVKLAPYSGPSEKPRELKIELLIKPGFKAYVDQFKLHILDPYPTKQSTLQLEPIHEFYDRFSKSNRKGVKEASTLTSMIEIHQPLKNGLHKLHLELGFQACSESVCYFPQTLKKEVEFVVQNETLGVGLSNDKPKNLLEENFLSAQQRGLPYLFIFVFLAGVLTSLTPCLLPMLPLTVAVIGKGHDHDHKLKKFINALTYVLGIATTYSTLGLIAASSGSLFGNILSHSWTQFGFGVAFVFMGLAQFGLFEFQTPLWLQNRFQKLGRATGGIFLSGLISGLIASPCVGPVLVGILTFIAKSQDHLLGFGLMFIYALGLGQLLIVLGVSSSLLYKFPKAPWIMTGSKTILGFALIASGLFYLSLLWPKFNGSDNKTVYTNSQPSDTDTLKTKQTRLPWLSYSDQAFEEAQKAGKPILLDFFADWCLACHELEDKTFSAPELEEIMKTFTLMRFDATKESPELIKLRKKYGIMGLPTILFFSSAGEWQEELTLNEFETIPKFKERLEKIKK